MMHNVINYFTIFKAAIYNCKDWYFASVFVIDTVIDDNSDDNGDDNGGKHIKTL